MDPDVRRDDTTVSVICFDAVGFGDSSSVAKFRGQHQSGISQVIMISADCRGTGTEKKLPLRRRIIGGRDSSSGPLGIPVCCIGERIGH